MSSKRNKEGVKRLPEVVRALNNEVTSLTERSDPSTRSAKR